MSVSKLPNGRHRAQVYNPDIGRVVSAAKILGLRRGSFATEREAKDAVTHARDKLRARGGSCDVTVRAWFERWATDRRFERPAASTNVTYRQQAGKFVERYGALLLGDVDNAVVDEWLCAGNEWTVSGLRVMFSDAMRRPLCLVASNPFVGLGLRSSPGRAAKAPPSWDQAQAMLGAARRLTSPGFAAWLQIAMFTGMRGGELDALRWDCVHLDASYVLVRRQFSAKTGTFTPTKNKLERKVPLLQPARDALAMARVEGRGSEFVCTNSRGTHWTHSSRQYQFGKVLADASVTFCGDIYLATRHFAGWYLYEYRRYADVDVAKILGHQDGGELVRKLYGHHDAEAGLERILRGERDADYSAVRRVA